MQQQLSPKKYIETQARKLPVHQCLVNTDWEQTQMANVVIMRRHVNGNVTLGLYLVDLLCLGVKDTLYKFNIPQYEADEMFANKDFFVEINYNLAHNIVFAGHDFAMEFNIPPHKNFALTKNILAEDNDNVPLIDIVVGDKVDGKPHLMINPYGEGKWALELLKKNAGEGNYYFTTEIGFGNNDEDDYDDDDDDDYDSKAMLINNYAMGTISAMEARDISTEQLLNPDNIKGREDFEKITLSIEAMIRVFEADENYAVIQEAEFIKTAEFELNDSCSTDEINSSEKRLYLEDLDEDGFIEEDIRKIIALRDEAELAPNIEKLITRHAANFYALTELYKLVMMHEGGLEATRKQVCIELNKFTEEYPLAKLYLAFESVYNNTPDLRFANIQYSNDIQSCFPQYESFGNLELQLYWLIKMVKNINDDKLEKSIFYYQLAVDTLTDNEFLLQAQMRILGYFNTKVPMSLN
jgi:hypothetical protein